MIKNTSRNHLAHDPHRPQFHFLPPANWLNDPNGLIQWQGQYHLFYQYNPNGPFHGTIHWGHAVSQDLVHWQDLPVALTPTPGGYDEAGCWSGCCVDHEGVPTIIYTGIHPQMVCLATGSDDLVSWEKYQGNPVIPAPPEELEGRTGGQFRDPFVWRENESWHMAIGSKIEGQGGLILHYRSADLVHWEYLGILIKGDITETTPFWTGTIWECPNFFELDRQYILFFSAQSEPHDLLYPVYYTGSYDGQRFTPSNHDILVHGQYFYAPQAMRTQDGRIVMWGWLREGRRPAALMEAGWAGVMSLPITLSSTQEGKIRLEPAEELKSLRRDHQHFGNLEIPPGSTCFMDGIQGDCLEIKAVFKPDPTGEFGIQLLCSPDGEEQTRLVYDARQKRLIIEPNDSSLSTVVDRDMRKAPLSLDANGELSLHIFLDRSVLEVFANGDTCLVSRIYPTRPDSQGLGLFARSGGAKVKSIDVWRLGSIW